MKFQKYTDIESSQRQKDVDLIVVKGFSGGEWVVSEKAHGSNFSFWYDFSNDEIKCAKRSGFIGEMETFNNYERVLDKYKPSLFSLKERILERFDFIKGFVLYGEILGGVFRGIESVPGAIKVQREIMYTPDNDFYAFDMCFLIEEEMKEYIDYDNFSYLMDCVKIPYAKALFMGSFEEALKYPNEFDSTIPELYGYPKLENNICEGVVIRPFKTKYYGPTRLILKNKNEKWSEKSNKSKGSKIPVKDVTPEQKELLENFLVYNTENRLKNVISKIGKIEPSDFGMLLGHMVQDILKDSDKDDVVQGEMSSEDFKRVKKLLHGEVALLIRSNFINILDGNF